MFIFLSKLKNVAMKNILYYPIVVLLLCVSCVNQIGSDDVEIASGNVPISFTTEISPYSTRMLNNRFTTGDEVGLYAVIANSSLNGNRYLNNISLSCTDANTLRPKSDVYYPEGDYNLDVYAYYPYQSVALESGKTTLTVSVKDNQETDEAFSMSDFMAAKKLNVKNGSSEVALNFKHKLSKISIKLVFNDAISANKALKSNPKVFATDFCSTAIYDFANDAVRQPSTLTNMIPHGTWKSDDVLLVGKELLVVPQSIENQKLILDLDGKIYICTLNEETLEKGFVYEYPINMDDLTEGMMNRISATITDWEKGESQETESNTELPSLNIEALSFTTSNIYHIYHAGMPIAEICKEYLYKDGEIDSRAIVVYPVVNGNTNLQSGLVLKLLDESGNVHGGRVSWNEDTNELTYVGGNSSPILNLYVDDSKQVVSSQPNTSLPFNVCSFLLRDTRNNVLQEYPLVKVATQYWMRDDLYTSYFSDGSPIKKLSVLNGAVGYLKNETSSHYFYTGEAVNSGLLAPIGTRMPNDVDWNMLETYLDGITDALKDNFWDEFEGQSYYPGNGKSGFEMHPWGMYIELNGESKIINQGTYTGYWMTEGQSNKLHEEGKAYQFSSKDKNFKTVSGKVSGKDYYQAFSVRCIKE